MTSLPTCQALLNRPGGALGAYLLIGQERGATLWRVIQAELALDDDVVVTLKSKSAFGVLPDVAWDAVPEPHRPQVRAALERVLDSAFRETPVSVIDQCRNAATVVLSTPRREELRASPLLALDDVRRLLGLDPVSAATRWASSG